MSLIDTLAQAIAQMEGFNTPGSVAQRNNNPGNLTASPYATGNVNGYSVFPDAQTGWQALDYQLQLYADRGLTLEDLFTGTQPGANAAYPNGFPGYAPAGQTGNDPTSYLSYVVSQLGVGPSTSLSTLYDSATATISTDVSALDNSSPSSSDAGFVTGDLLSWLSGSDGGDGGGDGLGVGIALVALVVLGVWWSS